MIEGLQYIHLHICNGWWKRDHEREEEVYDRLECNYHSNWKENYLGRKGQCRGRVRVMYSDIYTHMYLKIPWWNLFLCILTKINLKMFLTWTSRVHVQIMAASFCKEKFNYSCKCPHLPGQGQWEIKLGWGWRGCSKTEAETNFKESNETFYTLIKNRI